MVCQQRRIWVVLLIGLAVLVGAVIRHGVSRPSGLKAAINPPAGLAALPEQASVASSGVSSVVASPTYAALATSWTRILAGAKEERLPESVADEFRWLAASQMASGAIALNPHHQRIVPYFGNYAAMTLLRYDPSAVRSYIDWYLRHLNRPDRFGLSGTVYDYVIEDGRELSERDYDSADSYAATFLTLVGRYVFATGDGQLVLDNLADLHLIAQVCLDLQDPLDDLVWAKADQRYKFLMDNCEVQLGLDTWGEVLRALGLWGEAPVYTATAERIRQAIEAQLWQADTGSYAWAKTVWGARPIRNRWYPDAVGQLYPALFGVIDPAGERAQRLLHAVHTAYPRWPEIMTGDRFPWAMVAYASVLGGESGPAEAFVATVRSRFIASGRPWPWYILESAFYIDTLAELSSPGSSFPRRR